MKKYISILFSSLILSVFMAGCIDDDLSVCPSGRYLCFETINKKHVFQKIVNSVDLYIYDGDKLIDQKNYTRQDLQVSDYKVFLDERPNGTSLRYVALINQGKNYYQSIDIQNKETMLTELVASEGNTVKNKLPYIYHGTKDIEFDYSLSGVPDTIYLKENTNNVNLFVTFDGYELPADHKLFSYITGSNGQYDCENNPITEKTYTYLPYQIDTNDGEYAYVSRFMTMRLWLGSDTEINLEKEDNSTSSGSDKIQKMEGINIANYISKVKDTKGELLYDTNEKLESEDEFNIYVKLDGNFVIMELIVNNWHVIQDGIEL